MTDKQITFLKAAWYEHENPYFFSECPICIEMLLLNE